MTAETVLQNVLLEVGRDVQGASVGSTDYTIRQIVKFMNATGEDVASRAEWSRLSIVLNVAGAQSAVALPSDFHRMTEKGAVRLNKPGFHPLRQVISSENWAFLSGRPSSQLHYHLGQGQLQFSPALPSEGAIVRYVSKNWLQGRDTISQNGDELLIPEKLVEKGAILRWRRQKGLPFDDQMAEFEADLLTEIEADRGRA